MFVHVSVMPKEVLEGLALRPGMTVADLTAGGGGHLALIAEAVAQTGRVFGYDRDPRAHELDAAGGVAVKYPWVKLIQAPFSSISSEVQFDGVLADLGVSSPQLDTPERGLSFMQEGPLDMRMDTSSGETAYELIQELSEEELANVIYQYGEERLSRRIARAIKFVKPLPDSTLALADIIKRAYRGPRSKIHPATRTFQALRIAVNHELDELERLLASLASLVKPGGRAAIISFHSLEDRLVKNYFRNHPEAWRILTKKPLVASDEELSVNPRARSAKLRIAERVNV